MSMRYESATAADLPVDTVGPGTELGANTVEQHALVIGDPSASAFAVEGSQDDLRAFAERVTKAVDDIRIAPRLATAIRQLRAALLGVDKASGTARDADTNLREAATTLLAALSRDDPGDDDLELLLETADDNEDPILRDVACRAGLLWLCEDCGEFSRGHRATCEGCGAAYEDVCVVGQPDPTPHLLPLDRCEATDQGYQCDRDRWHGGRQHIAGGDGYVCHVWPTNHHQQEGNQP